jgi:hypothetical protein
VRARKNYFSFLDLKKIDPVSILTRGSGVYVIPPKAKNIRFTSFIYSIDFSMLLKTCTNLLDSIFLLIGFSYRNYIVPVEHHSSCRILLYVCFNFIF